ncbi:MAG TPA: dihydroneopterin aldolase [Egibacteraceae bacterium]|nr:dihydroneopterin aldolase [Egibacteraceae bacterium]
MDRIEISGLRAFGRHGVLPEERENGQHFLVDLALECDLSMAAESDDLADTVDYDALSRRIVEEIGATRFDLIEALAGHLAGVVLGEPRVAAVEVRVAKPEVRMPVDDVAVVLRRHRAGGRAGP